MKRYILTGTPGAGKTSILRALEAAGYSVVEEAATDVNLQAHAAGDREPHTRPDFIDKIVALQRLRQIEAPEPPWGLQIYDRSPICTHALRLFLGRPISPALSAELDRLETEAIYQRQVLFIRNLGFCEPTSVRKISFEESLVFEEIHRESYRRFGYDCIDVPAMALPDRVKMIVGLIADLNRPTA